MSGKVIPLESKCPATDDIHITSMDIKYPNVGTEDHARNILTWRTYGIINGVEAFYDMKITKGFMNDSESPFVTIECRAMSFFRNMADKK